MTEYIYARDNLLEERNNYFYTRYEGRAFLAAWRQQRDAAAKYASDGVTQADVIIKPTDHMLEMLWQALAEKKTDAALLHTLGRLLQRFEVTKRLHGEYNADWRPVDPADYLCMERYVRFAEIMDLVYALTSRLKFLNGLLKCMDTLTGMAAQLNSLQRDRVDQLIANERDHVDKLMFKIDIQSDGCHRE